MPKITKNEEHLSQILEQLIETTGEVEQAVEQHLWHETGGNREDSWKPALYSRVHCNFDGERGNQAPAGEKEKRERPPSTSSPTRDSSPRSGEKSLIMPISPHFVF